MRRSLQQIVGAFLLGLLIPGMLLNIGATLERGEGESQQQTQVETRVDNTGTAAHPEPQWKITVCIDGERESMELESYLVGVVLAEMPTDFEEAALQAQAVVARTYALKRQQQRDHHSDGAVCTDHRCCQAYISVADYLNGMGTQEDVDKATQAVTATAGQVVTYEGKLIESTYFSCSGGRTEDAAAVWGGDYPYLRAVDSPGEERAESYETTNLFTKEQLEMALERALPEKTSEWIGWCTYTIGGGVDKLCLAGQIYKGTQLRQLLDLRSTMFSVETVENGIKVTTYGSGHRVGMSQWGAEAMAVAGSTVEEILAHYYPGTQLETMTSE